MDAQKRIDKILAAAKDRVQEEVSALLGADLSLSPIPSQTITKEQFFDGLSGKQVFAKIDLSGDLEGLGALVVGIKDAIRLGRHPDYAAAGRA